MPFSIKLLQETPVNLVPSQNASYGIITIGSFEERFVATLDYWCAKDYEQHWKQAIGRIVQVSDVSCLITSMHNPAAANFLFWWPMYRVGDTVFFQHHILFFDELPSPFNEHDPYACVPERKILNEDGEAISEWSASVDDLILFFTALDRSDPQNDWL